MAFDTEEEVFEGNSDVAFENEDDNSEKRKPILFFVALLLVVVSAGGVASYFFIKKPPVVSNTKATQDVSPGVGSGNAAPANIEVSGPPAYYDIPVMLVNVAATGRQKNFLKLQLTLELGSEADISKVEMVVPRFVDGFQTYLRELRLEQLQGASGMFRVREEALIRINALVRPIQVKDVLFKEMIIQ